MSINAKVDGTTYEGIDMISVGGKNVVLQEVSETVEPQENPFEKFFVSNDENLGDITLTMANPYLSALNSRTFGKIELPNATTLGGQITNVVGDAIIAPNVVLTLYSSGSIGLPSKTSFSMRGSNIGIVDLSGLQAQPATTGNQTFFGGTFGTLKIGHMKPHNGYVQNATITNLLYPITSAEAALSAIAPQFNNATQITNLYVADNRLAEFQEALSSGTLTKVANVYAISAWED